MGIFSLSHYLYLKLRSGPARDILIIIKAGRDKLIRYEICLNAALCGTPVSSSYPGFLAATHMMQKAL